MKDNYIGENIKIYRERRKLTQQELGDMIGKTWEMISRYERGVSSPLKQLTNLADALNISPSSLLKDQADYSSNNKIPLFLEVPKSFSKQNTFNFYTCPDWVIQYDEDSFVVDSNIILRNNAFDSIKKGYLYISPNSIYEDGDLFLTISKDKLGIEEFNKDLREKIVGKIVAQEIRL